MKVTVYRKPKSEGREYPWIGISKIESIVLFIRPLKGVLLKKHDPDNPNCKKILQSYLEVGEYSEVWSEADFETFHGEIVLSNS